MNQGRLIEQGGNGGGMPRLPVRPLAPVGYAQAAPPVDGINLRGIISILNRRRGVIALCTVLALLVGVPRVDAAR